MCDFRQTFYVDSGISYKLYWYPKGNDNSAGQDHALEGRTIFVIAYCLSTVRIADVIWF